MMFQYRPEILPEIQGSMKHFLVGIIIIVSKGEITLHSPGPRF